MLREVVLASICFIWLSGCALTETGNVNESQNAASNAADFVPDITAADPVASTPLSDTASAGVEDKKFGPEYVKEIQAHLKRSGFYSGAVDGIAGAKTQSAVRHFQSGCATLKDLIPVTDATGIREEPPAVAKGVARKNGRSEAVRITQLRLKDAGFDPGPIDGIAGAKTRAALAALESGCKMLGDIGLMSLGRKPIQQPEPAKAIRTTAVNSGAENFTELPSGNSSQEATRVLQKRLGEAGFDPGPADGILGPSKTAAQRYQSSLQ